MATATMEFEKPIYELERQIDELKKLAGQQSLNVTDEIAPLGEKLVELRTDIYRSLTPLQRVQVARSGGARAERRHGAKPLGDEAPGDADHRHGDWRGRLGGRACARRRRPRQHARELGLFGHHG